jgi:hypothetical protein
MSTPASSTGAAAAAAGLPPDLFDPTTILSLLSTAALVLAAYGASLIFLPRASTLSTSSYSGAITATTLRFLFIWHAADALCHFVLEGSFLYHCFFSASPVAELLEQQQQQQQRQMAMTTMTSLSTLPLWPTPRNWLGRGDGHSVDFAYGPQAGGQNPFAQLWMVYARADIRWAGVDLVGKRTSTPSTHKRGIDSFVMFSCCS